MATTIGAVGGGVGNCVRCRRRRRRVCVCLRPFSTRYYNVLRIERTVVVCVPGTVRFLEFIGGQDSRSGSTLHVLYNSIMCIHSSTLSRSACFKLNIYRVRYIVPSTAVHTHTHTQPVPVPVRRTKLLDRLLVAQSALPQ